MNFKTKTILLFLTTSLIPYLLTITYILYSTKQELTTQINKDLDFNLELISKQLDSQIDGVYKDFLFISKLDMMDDIMSMDIDRRITNLLISKKEDINLVGDFFVVNNQNKIVASSDVASISKELNLSSDDAKIFRVDIIGSFNTQKIGSLYLQYSFENFKPLLKSKPHQFLYLWDEKSQKYLFKSQNIEDSIGKSKGVESIKELHLHIAMDRTHSLKLYNKFQTILLFAIVIGLMLILWVSIYFASKITKPINTLSQTAQNIASTKNYTQRVTIDSKDEIGKMAKAFNGLIVSIEEALKELKVQNQQKLKLIEEKSKNEMFKTLSTKLSKYLSPQIYNSIFQGEQDVKLESKRKKLTIFFSDIVGFTATTESMESEDLSQLLNHYLNEMSLIALKHGATIDKFIGDAILIFFGDPKSEGIKTDALRCLAMSLEMIEKVKELESYWQSMGIAKPFKVRIGINTGFCTVGNFGSEDRMDYTIIGGAVNLASRIESKAKPNEIWISQETQLLIKDEIECQAQEAISAKGISQPIKIYKVIGYLSKIKEPLTLEGLSLEDKKVDIKDKDLAISSLKKLLKSIESNN
jgi:class 3 adenylate cyclase/HAMP domain-containing protein